MGIVTLPGPSRTIIVEPVETPQPVPLPVPAPAGPSPDAPLGPPEREITPEREAPVPA
jgi:hypothetical protein